MLIGNYRAARGAPTMNCRQCGHDNPAGAARCAKCDTSLELKVGAASASTGGWSAETPADGATSTFVSSTSIESGTLLGGRYEILQLLGEGGMGAVYKAKDRALDRFVALKVIRTELSHRPEILQRFKQELILARQITHKNVIRIFDLGEAEGIKFISMDFVEGRDLKSLVREKGKLNPEEAKNIIIQVCRALNAAHAEGVIHRDLKPQNIMVDSEGRVTVMDFGIARSMAKPGLTQTGMVVGTPEYMSPEQGKGETVDGRSDVYSLGVIFYELLTGTTPHHADTALAIMLKRTQEIPRPPKDLDPTVPDSLNRVAMKCLEIEPARRYQTARQILEDLEARTSTRTGLTPAAPVGWKEILRGHKFAAAAALAAVLVVTVGLFVFRSRLAPGPPAPTRTVTLLISDFDNQTQDPVFDGTLEPMMEVALEGASFINAYKRDTARKVATELQPGAAKLSESLARLVAVREGIPVVVGGRIGQSGDQYTVSADAVDANTGKRLVEEHAEAKNKNDVLGVVGKLAAGIRKALGDTTPESRQIAAAETFTTTSLEAAHQYALAQNQQWAGKWNEATEDYLKATELDPNMGRAFSGLAVVAYNTGHVQEANKYFQVALSKIDRMSDREKYRTRGSYYLMTGNADKAVDELGQLVKQFPSDSAGVANLAFAYFLRRDMKSALEEGRHAIEIYPKSVPQLNNLGLYAMYAGDFDEALKEQKKVLELNPAFAKAYVGTATSELAQGRLEEAKATYQKLESVSPQGASVASAGLADLALYEGRLDDAISILEKGAAADFDNKSPDAAAWKLVTLAHAQLLSGKAGPARAALEKALGASQETSVMFWAARDYIDLGDDSKALALAKELGSQFGADQQAYAKLIEGEADLKHGKPQDAIRIFQDAQKVSNTWLGHLDLARAYIAAGGYAEADSEIETSLKRRGEATAAFLDEVPTCRLIPPLYYYHGRAQEGLKSAEAPQSYEQFLAMDKGQDPLAADARRRLASLESPGGSK